MIAAGLAAGATSAETMMLVSSALASGLVGLLLGAAFGANLAHSFVNDALDFIGVCIGIACPDVRNGALKHAAAHSFLNELRSAFPKTLPQF
jgi:hypothetical protein